MKIIKLSEMEKNITKDPGAAFEVQREGYVVTLTNNTSEAATVVFDDPSFWIFSDNDAEFWSMK